MKLKILLSSLMAFSLSSLTWAADNNPVLPPDIPVCSGNTCPYVIQQGNYSASISCSRVKNTHSDFSCMLTASDGGPITTQQNLEDNLDSNLTAIWLSPTLLEIKDHFKQGRAAYFTKRTIFIDFENLEISPIFFNVYAINLNKLVVLCESAMTEDQTVDQHIFVIPMFNPKKSISIERNFSGLYIHDIYPQPLTRFLPNGNLELVYFSRDHKTVKETIPIDYKQFESES